MTARPPRWTFGVGGQRLLALRRVLTPVPHEYLLPTGEVSHNCVVAIATGDVKMHKFLLATLLFSLLALPAAALPDDWEEPPLSASPPARYGHSMVNLNGEIYIFGGLAGDAPTARIQSAGEVLDDLWKLKEEDAKWENIEVGTAPLPRVYHAAAPYYLYPDDLMFVVFGQDSGGYRNDVWQYNPSTNFWTQRETTGGGVRGACPTRQRCSGHPPNDRRPWYRAHWG